MSPLLGSSGGSSEYAFRGTLDDWPVDFSTALAAQNPALPIDPVTTVTATLTITGLNYKARVIAEHPNVTVSVTSEFGVAVTDGREIYAPRKATDPPLFIRDQSVLSIRLQPTSGTTSDFLKTYTIPVKVGKRQGTWTVSTRAIDDAPTPFSFNSLIDQELGITTTTTPPVIIAGLENGFSFPISVVANQVGGNVSYFKNGTQFTTSSTVVNGDQIYLSTLTPTSYSTPRTFTVQVGTFTTSWGILTRNAVTTVNPFSFTGISSANQLGFGYTSGFMTISGADPGPTDPLNPATWPTDPTALLVTRVGIGSFQIIKSDGSLRYKDPANLTAPNYWQTSPTYAFNGDRINVKVSSSASYNTTTSTTLNVSDKSAGFIVTTRPAPIDTIPATFTFTNLLDQQRGALVTSGIVTLSSMIAGSTGTASIPTSTAGVGAQFNVNGGAWISPPTTANVGLGDTIRLRMTTPVSDPLSGVTNSSVTFRVTGTDTTANIITPTDNPEGYTTFGGFQESIWNVTTIARTCPITAFTLTSISDRPLSSDNTIDFTVGGFNTDCRMRVEVTSASTNYNFTAVNGVAITPTKTLTNVAPGSIITLSVRASALYLTDVTATVTVTNNNTPDTVTPESSYSTTWTVKTVADTTPASVTLTGPAGDVVVGAPFTINWSTINCILPPTTGTVRSVSGTNWTTLPTTLNGSVTLNAPTTAGASNYVMTVYSNPSAINTPPLPSDALGKYATSNTLIVNVIEDTTPIFTNSTTGVVLGALDTFGSIGPVALSTPTASNTFVISDYTTALRGTIVAPTGVTASFTGGGATRTFDPPGSVAGTLAARTFSITVTSSALYLTTDTVDVVFDWLPPGALSRVEVARKSFSVTTQACVPGSVTTGSTVLVNGASTCNVTYYTLVSWTTSTGSLIVASDVFPYTPTGTTTKGVITTTGTGLAGVLAGGVTVTWRQYIDALWDVYVANTGRPPRQSEIEGAFTGFPLSAATSLAVYQSQILAGQIQGGTGVTPLTTIRSSTVPLTNSCDVAFYP